MFRGAPRGQRVLLNLRTKGAHHGRSKPWAEMRELISTGRVKPVGRGEWMLPGPLQSSAPSSPMLPPMLPPRAPDRLPDDFESMMARVRSSNNAAWDEYYRNIPRQSSQEGSMSTVPPEPLAPAVLPRPLPGLRVRLRVIGNAPRPRLSSHAWMRTSENTWLGSPSRFSGNCPRSVGPSRTWATALPRSVVLLGAWMTALPGSVVPLGAWRSA